ncbi:MAG: CPBP family glutamic-type intramembrane protease [Roseiarcus sp.]|jgi:membrane protease YdiL (CAAX protease family)
MPPSPSIPPIAVLVALIAAGALPLANYIANHVARTRRGAWAYPLAVVFAAGTLAPLLAARWLTRSGWIGSDLPIDGADAPVLGGALVVGLALIALALRGPRISEFPHILRLLAALFAVSLAEVLVFLSLLFAVTERIAASTLASPWATLAAGIVSSVAFGLYHFTHPPPWNAWARAAPLMIVWLFVCLAYVATRDAWAAAIVDACFATIGFVKNRVKTLDDMRTATALALDALSVAAVVVARWA